MIVIDSDALIEIYDKNSAKGEELLRRICESGEKPVITSITLHEVLYGLQKYGKPVGDIVRLPVLGYEKEDARLAAELELRAEKHGVSVARADAMVAAIAINSGAKLCTLNLRHFKRFEPFGLQLFR